MRRFGACRRKSRLIGVARTITASAFGTEAAMVCSFTGSSTSTVTPGAFRSIASASSWTERRQMTWGMRILLCGSVGGGAGDADDLRPARDLGADELGELLGRARR